MKAICFFDVDDTLVPFGLNDIREQEKKDIKSITGKWALYFC